MPVIHHLKPPLQAQGQSLGRSGKVHQRTWLRDAPGIGIEEIMEVGVTPGRLVPALPYIT